MTRLNVEVVEVFLAARRDFLEGEIQREGTDRIVDQLLHPKRDARSELVLAVLDPGVVPAAGRVDDLNDLLDVNRPTAAGCRDEPNDQCSDKRPGARPHRSNCRSEDLDVDFLPNLGALGLVGHVHGEIAPLHAQNDRRHIEELVRRERSFTLACGDRQPFVRTEIHGLTVVEHRVDERALHGVGVLAVRIVHHRRKRGRHSCWRPRPC